MTQTSGSALSKAIVDMSLRTRAQIYIYFPIYLCIVETESLNLARFHTVKSFTYFFSPLNDFRSQEAYS